MFKNLSWNYSVVQLLYGIILYIQSISSVSQSNINLNLGRNDLNQWISQLKERIHWVIWQEGKDSLKIMVPLVKSKILRDTLPLKCLGLVHLIVFLASLQIH